MSEIAIYESAVGQVEVRLEGEPVWLNQRQLATTENFPVVQRAGIARQLKPELA